MLAQLIVAPLFIAASAVAHPAVMRRGDVALSDWPSQNLESYWRFKTRYSSLNCASQTGTDFYTSCCYPLGASESLSDRPAECTPATLTCSGSTSASPSIATTVPTPNASSTDDVYDESTLPWCEEGDDGYEDDGSDEEENTYTNQSNNGGSTSTTTTDSNNNNSQPQPTDNTNTGSDNSGNTGNTGSNNSGTTTNTPSTDNNGGSSGGDNTGGHATYYYQNGNAGACGDFHGDYDYIGAIDQAWYGDLGSRSQYCGRSVRITNTDNGKSVTILVADVCPTCDAANSFDLSVGAFQQLADLSAGYIPISWSFV